MPKIMMTLGRTQPPHNAHIRMLTDAYFKLQPGDMLLHFIGSSNVPLRFDDKNILSFEERQDILLSCLKEEVARRVKHGANAPQNVIVNFIPLPDYSDKEATFTSTELAQKEKCIEKAKAFSHPLGLNYIAWGINVLDTLAQHIPAGSKNVDVVYEVCNKDAAIQEYVDLLKNLATALHATLPFTFNVLICQPMLSYDQSPINATTMRKTLRSLIKTGKSLEEIKIQACEPTSPLYEMPIYALEVTYHAMCREYFY